MLAYAALLALLASQAHASTYDEPWQEEVLREADALVKLRIVRGSETEAQFERLEQLAGQAVPERGSIDRFAGMNVTSTSSMASGFPLLLNDGDEGYFTLGKTDDAARWSIATPTSGYALVGDGKVTATFRHSYHQALVPEPLYREATLAIFQKLHGEPWDAEAQRASMEALLAQPPASIGTEAERFFQQHVALESCYHFCTAADLPSLEPFLASEDHHVQISAVRALSAADSPEGRARLLAFVKDDSRAGFARVMAVWGLARLDAREHAEALLAYLPQAPTDETGFGGNIMDPRVGTSFPNSVQDAIEELLKSWEG